MNNHNKILLTFAIVLTGLLMLTLVVRESSGDTFFVDDDAPDGGDGSEGDPYNNIQDAINASGQGDTVRVFAGTYYENVRVNKAVNLIGNGSETTTIDGGGNGDVVRIDEDYVNMSGFMVIGSGDESQDSGISVESDHNLIFKNSCSNNNNGIYLWDSSDCNIENNTCSENNDHGIYVRESSSCTIMNNTCSENSNYGIFLRESSDCTITNNSCSKNNASIFLLESSSCTITNNAMNENDIVISGHFENWNSHTIDTTNTVNGKPVYYYKNDESLTVPYGAGQVILANCTGIHVVNQNFSNGSNGILVGYSSKITLMNNTCSANTRSGIALRSSDNNTIANNTCSANNWYGISLRDSDYNTLTNNTCKNNNVNGIYIAYSEFCTIMYNKYSANDFGISLYHTSDCTVVSNTCSANEVCGISLDSSERNTIKNNTISDNHVGIYIESSSQNNTVHYNNIFDNTECGINATNNEGNSVDAIKNWWGDASGPYHPTENPDGKGDNVTDYVEFEPWLEDKWLTVASIVSISPNPAIVGESIQFKGQGTGKEEIVRYVWRSSIDGEFYNGTESNCTNDSLSLGVHTIYFKVRDDKGNWSEEVNASLVITAKPIAIIESISPDPALHTDTIHFQGNGTDEDGTITRYTWRSSIDGEFYNGTDKNVYFDSLTNDTHSIYLKVRDNYGIWSEEVSEVLTVNGKPVAVIESISPSPGLDTDLIDFQGIGQDDGMIIQFAWRSSIDGEFYNSTLGDFNYGDLSNGTHIIYFKVQDDYWFWSDEVQTTLTIYGRPVARIDSISPNPALDTETIDFKGIGTDDGSITRYVWSSSIDGEIHNDASDANFTKSDLSLGEHIISFKVQDDHDVWSEEIEVSLIVHSQPTASIISIDPNPALKDENVIFDGIGTDDKSITAYNWRSSEDGTVGTHASFSISSLSVATHIIYFKVKDNHGVWSEEVSETLVIHEIPRASIVSITPRFALDTDIIRFIGSGDGTIVRYSWRSDLDGEFYNGTEAVSDYGDLSNGTHYIYFKVLDDFGLWSKEVGTRISVNGMPTAFIDSISPETANETDTVRFTGHGTDDGTILRYIWNSSIDGELYNGSKAWFDFSSFSSGTHVISLEIMDDRGVWSSEVTATLQIIQYMPPNLKPTMVITLPRNNSRVSGDTVLKGIASDEDGTVERVEVSIDGGPWQTVTGTTIWKFKWDSEEAGDGEITIGVRAFDGTEYSETVNLYLVVENEEEKCRIALIALAILLILLVILLFTIDLWYESLLKNVLKKTETNGSRKEDIKEMTGDRIEEIDTEKDGDPE